MQRGGHQPVMVDRVMALVEAGAGRLYVDATLGLGGYAERVLEASGPDGRVIGFDRDGSAIERSRARLRHYGARLVTVHASFSDLAVELARLDVHHVDGVVYDLGVSSPQLDEAPRGFSYRADGPLDMRMDPSTGVTAATIVADYSLNDLRRILRDYGEERFAGRVARAICVARERVPIETTAALAEIVRSALPPAARRDGPHPARRTFQALRIEVNAELVALEQSLPQAVAALRPGGRLVALSYHSLEDRIVKRALGRSAGREVDVDRASGSAWSLDRPQRGGWVRTSAPPSAASRPENAPLLELLTLRPERPSSAEIAANPRARSAKLRAAQRCESPEERESHRTDVVRGEVAA